LIVQPAAASTPARFVVDLRVTSLAPALQLLGRRQADNHAEEAREAGAEERKDAEREEEDGEEKSAATLGDSRRRIPTPRPSIPVC
jgi:hypothetical protein